MTSSFGHPYLTLHFTLARSKSTILKHAETKLRSQGNGTVCLTFNGWLFEGYEDAKSALMGNILEELEKQLKDNQQWNERIGEAIAKLLKRVNWLKVAKATAGVALPLSTRQFRETLCGKLKTRFSASHLQWTPHLVSHRARQTLNSLLSV